MRPQIVPYRHLQLAETLITENEALTVKPYKDQVGKLTIGYGRNLEDRGIRYSEAELMLANDIAEAEESLSKEFGFFWGLSDERKAVMIDMYHNLGLSGLMKFQNMIAAIRVKDWDRAAHEIQDSRYWEQVGVRAQRNYYMMKFDVFATQETVTKYFASR